MRYVFLNSFPLNAFNITKPTKFYVKPININELREKISKTENKVSYIRHQATAELLNKLLNTNLNVSSELYQYNKDDVIYVVILKKPIRGAEINNITENDIQIYQVEVIE